MLLLTDQEFALLLEAVATAITPETLTTSEHARGLMGKLMLPYEIQAKNPRSPTLDQVGGLNDQDATSEEKEDRDREKEGEKEPEKAIPGYADAIEHLRRARAQDGGAT